MTDKKRKKTRTGGSRRGVRNDSQSALCLAAIDAVEHAIHVVDRDLRIVIFNRTFKNWCRDLNIDVDNVLGKTVLEAFPFLPNTVPDEYTQVFKTASTVSTDDKVIIDGRTIYTQTEKVPVFQDGSVTHIVTIVADVTEFRIAREKLRANEEQYRLVVENVPTAIAILDNDGIFLFINKQGASDMGHAAKEIAGKSLYDIFPGELADRQLRMVRQVIQRRERYSEIARTKTSKGWGWYDVILEPYIDSQGRVIGALLIANDITHHMDAIEALQESEERFRQQFQSIPLPTYIWEHRPDDFYLLGYNSAAHDITSGNIKDFVGRKASEMYRHMPDIRRDLKRCLGRKETICREMPYRFMSTGEEKFLIVYYVYVSPNKVLVHTEDITERKRARDALQRAHDDLEQRVQERTRELAAINEALQVEREALRQKNIALNEVLDQIEEGKRQLTSQIQANISRIALPILKSLERRVEPSDLQFIDLLRVNLKDIASPLTSRLEERFSDLTPREMEICHLVKNGLSCKEIAATFNTSLQTVLKQRAIIRKKIGISNQKINLVSFLNSL